MIDKVLLGVESGRDGDKTFLKSPTESWTQSCEDKFIACG